MDTGFPALVDRLLPLIFVVILLLAGCMSRPSDSGAIERSSERDNPARFFFKAEGCVEGGFVGASQAAIGNGVKIAGVWEPIDIRDEVGHPLHDHIGLPVVGPLGGNWHFGFRCQSSQLGEYVESDFFFGWVGQHIKAPPWDPGGADIHILLGSIGFGDGKIAGEVRASTTADITEALRAHVDWIVARDLPRSFAYAEYTDKQKGVYQSWSTMAYYRENPERTIRFWWQIPADGSAARIWEGHQPEPQPPGMVWNPVYWDLHSFGGTQFITPSRDGIEIGAHNLGTSDHLAPAQPMLQIVYEHSSISFAGGEVYPEIRIDGIWAH